MIDLALGQGSECVPREDAGLSPEAEPRETPANDGSPGPSVSAEITDNESWREDGSRAESAGRGARGCSPHGASDKEPVASVAGASRLDTERSQTLGRITSANQRLSDLERQKEELEQELEIELALVQGELKAEREQLERDHRTADKLHTHIAGLSNALKAEKDKEKAKVERERGRLEMAWKHLTTSRQQFADQPESSNRQLRERLQEESEALEVAVKTFEDLEFQSLEKESRLEEERETQSRQLKEQLAQCRQQAVNRKERVRRLEEQIVQIKEQAKSGSERLAESCNEVLKAHGKHPRVVNRPIPGPVGDGSSELMGSAPCVLSTTRLSATEAFLKDPSLCENGSVSLPRRRREGRGRAETERPVSLHEKGLVLAPMQLLSLVALHRTNSFSRPRPKISSPPLDLSCSPCLRPDTLPGPSNQTSGSVRLTRASSLRSTGCSVEVLAEMERKLRAALAEKERLLQAGEARSRVSEKARTGERLLVGEPVESNPQPQPPANTEKGPRVQWMPIVKTTFDLRAHVEASGHGVEACPHLTMTGKVCRGFLTKMGGRIKTWRKRWFVFNCAKRRLTYFTDKLETKLKGVIYFQAIEEVYFDHLRSASTSPNPSLTFCLKTYDRLFYMVAPSDVALRIWIEVILTAVEGNIQF
uniref:pleckstrin homology-like domain family B member 3 n=1 Tax=Pristiophorus japonicus TaxID=55135 RepID=UPI00398F3BB5